MIDNEGPTCVITSLTNAANLFEDGNDSVTVTVTLSDHATLNGAGVTDNGDRTITRPNSTHSQLAYPTISPTNEFEGTVSVGVSALAHDGSAVSAIGSTATSLIVNPVADQPVVTAVATTIDTLSLHDALPIFTNAANLFEDGNDSVTVTVTLSDHATLNGAGVTDN